MRSNTTMVSTDTIMLWHCRYWSRPVKGRADKKFRCDGCRNADDGSVQALQVYKQPLL